MMSEEEEEFILCGCRNAENPNTRNFWHGSGADSTEFLRKDVILTGA